MNFRQFQQMPAAEGEALRILAGPVRLRGEWRLAPAVPAALQIRWEPHLP